MSGKYSFVGIFSILIFIIFISYMYSSIYQPYFNISNIYTTEKPLKLPLKSTFIHIEGKIKYLGEAKEIYIINLPYRKDRRTGSIGLFQKLNFDAFIIPGYDINSPEIISRNYLTYKNHIRLIEIACWASHIQIWLEIAKLKIDTWIFIFEDDIDLELSTYDILKSFPLKIWTIPDLIYLGHCGNAPGKFIYKGFQNYRLHQATHPGCTHAYAIRSSSAKKLIQFLLSPKKAIDDIIVDLVKKKKILAYSIHPPLAIQQLNTSIQPSEVSPIEYTLIYKLKGWKNYIFDKWTGVESINKLKNSTLAKVDLKKANEWRKNHENGIWINNRMNFSNF